MMAVIGSMAAILVHERKRIREIEAGTETIRQVRRDISEAHRCITRLALLGEGVVGWDETDYRHYHAQLLSTDSLLQAKRSTPAAHHGSDGAAGRRGQPAGEPPVRSGKAGDPYLIKSPCKLFTACRG